MKNYFKNMIAAGLIAMSLSGCANHSDQNGKATANRKPSISQTRTPEWQNRGDLGDIVVWQSEKPRVMSPKEQEEAGYPQYKYGKQKKQHHNNTVEIGRPHSNVRTLDVYDSNYNTIMYRSGAKTSVSGDNIVATQIFPHTLEQLVDKGIITHPMYEAGPLGIYHRNGRTHLDVKAGIRYMWDLKIARAERNNEKDFATLFSEMKHYFTKKLTHPTKTNLTEYRAKEISSATNHFKTACQNYALEMKADEANTKYQREMTKFMRNISEVMTPNMLLAYNIQELAPAGCNPVYRARYLDCLLRQGKEVVEGFPAIYDTCISYGPFQLTAEYAQGRINSATEYIPKGQRPPKKISQYSSLQDHATGAAMFAFSNWLNIGNNLARHGMLESFNAHFSDYKNESVSGDEGLVRRQLLVSGITAAMHYQPGTTMNAISRYLRSHRTKQGPLQTDAVGDMAVGMKRCFGNRGTERYYTGASEAFHLLRVYDVLADRYEPQYLANQKKIH